MSREPTVMRGEATARAPAAAVWRAFTDPARMASWFPGARDVVASPDFPRVGTTIRWRVGPSRFEARVDECDPPRLLRQTVTTPSATSTITHRVREAAGHAVYEKEVSAAWKGWFAAVVGRAFVARSVQREAERVARLAEAPAALTPA